VIVVADTSGLLAAFDKSQAHHSGARSVLLSEHLLISPFVLTELDHLVRRDLGFEAAMSIMDALAARMDTGQYRLASIHLADLQSAQQVRRAYLNLSLDLTDAINVVLADRHQTNLLLTFDHRDFRVVRPLGPRFAGFQLLPADVASN
jgi:predicted nucleic acid-binding protein